MNDERGLPSKEYMECARRLRQLHTLIRSGDGDSDQAEALRDEMDGNWIRMSQEERDWSGDLSADLHVLGMNHSLLDQPESGGIRQLLLEASRRDDWAGLRPLLNSDAHSADLFDRFLFRAIYWSGLHDYESSLEFLNGLASRMDAERSEIETMQLGLRRLTRAGKATDQIEVVQELGRLALERTARVSKEINRLIVDVQSMRSSAVTPGADLSAWPDIKERFFQAEEWSRDFSEFAA